ncbi:NAD-dependent epimerase/dehydratase family protein [Marinicella rhabdoformis]|uniref:NAD-dependent epimerase/dehydratase family protein n=1 Tax=Marinicella rhabdoformis TaxID=2580566 RepID=UPI0012AECB3A|nr:NAD-dependent epimerase/dehydratase family protein [Marinicella rhabdoformis]
MKTAFVTGATGFLGGHLCHLLVTQGWQITALCRSIPKNPIAGVNYVTGNLLDASSISDALENKTDVLFHVAADTNTWHKNNSQQTSTNIQGTKNIIEAAVAKQVGTLLYVSSIVTFGVDHHGLVNTEESNTQTGIDSWVNYVKTKSQAELLVKSAPSQLRTVITNPTHIIGPADQQNWIRLFKMIINDALPTIPQGAGSFADVRDVANGLILAAEKGKHNENYILGGNNLNFPDFIQHVCHVFGCKITAKVLPHGLVKMVAYLKSRFAPAGGKAPDITPESLQVISHEYAVSSNKAKTELGYTIKPLEQSLEDIKADLIERKILTP